MCTCVLYMYSMYAIYLQHVYIQCIYSMLQCVGVTSVHSMYIVCILCLHIVYDHSVHVYLQSGYSRYIPCMCVRYICVCRKHRQCVYDVYVQYMYVDRIYNINVCLFIQ